MATPPSPFGFFSPGRRRRAAFAPSGPSAPSASQRALEEAAEALRAIDAPAEIQENIGKDLKDAFDVKAQARAGYEASKPQRVGVNLIDAVTDPLGTFWETVSSPFATDWEKLLPQPDVVWKESESEVWEKLFTRVFVNSAGRSVVPDSLQAAVLRWNEGTNIRPARIAARKEGILKNPGLTEMMASGLARYYTPARAIVGVPLQNIIDSSHLKEREIAGLVERAGDNAMGERKLLKLADAADRRGNPAEAARLRARAAAATGGYLEARRLWREAGRRQKDWADDPSVSPINKEVQQEFERLMRTDPAFASTPEAQMWRYYKNRNLHYQTLNFLKTYAKGGVWGVTYDYAWNSATSAIFKKGTWREFLYLPNALSWLKDKTVGKLLTPALNKLTDLQAWYKRKVLNAVKQPLENALKGLGEKLGIKALGGLLGRVGLGAVGGPVGVVIGAAAQFVGGAILKELGDAKWLFVGIIAGTIGLVLFLTFSFFIIIGVVISNIKLPEISIGAAGAPVVITKVACDSSGKCQKPNDPYSLKFQNGTSEITWKITVQNSDIFSGIGGATISDKSCGLSSSFDLKEKELKTFPSCTETVSGRTNEAITNVVNFSSSRGSATGFGLAIIGNPPYDYPHGWPVANGAITQGPDTCSLGTSHCKGVDKQALDIDGGHVGETVFATHRGTVISSQLEVCGGNVVKIYSPLGFTSVYGHLDRRYVEVGDQVAAGAPIGILGQTGLSWGPFPCIKGAHLHYGLYDSDSSGNLISPRLIEMNNFTPEHIPVCSVETPVLCAVSWSNYEFK